MEWTDLDQDSSQHDYTIGGDLQFLGDNGISTSITGNVITHSIGSLTGVTIDTSANTITDAGITNKGIARFESTDFAVSNGQVSLNASLKANALRITDSSSSTSSIPLGGDLIVTGSGVGTTISGNTLTLSLSGITNASFQEEEFDDDGNLISIDILDYSKVSNNPKWKFVHSSDDNFDYTKKFIERKVDVLFIDSLHEPNHIRKVFYNYFNFVKINGLIFIDDVIWLPYVKGGYRDNDFVETTNRLTFNKILEIFNSNKDNLTLDMNFSASGLAIISKIGSHLNNEKKIVNRLLSFKNILKKLYKPKPKNWLSHKY